MKTLLLTGATGFVGRTFLLHAIASGAKIFAPVRNIEKLFFQLAAEGLGREAITPLPFDPAGWGDVQPTHALLSGGVFFARHREEYFKINVAWNMQVLRALPASCRIVVLSSQSAGGPTPNEKKARTESDADAPLTWYGESKLELERAIFQEFPTRPITVLRPAMILGARDTATLPLFKMASGFVRTKPGLREKWFSFVGVDDVVNAILAAFDLNARGPFYIAGESPVSDLELIAMAAKVAGKRGVTLAMPLPLLRLLAKVVDAIPRLREATPSLTRDRAREIWPDRWIVDAGAFRRASGWNTRTSLENALRAACAHFQSAGHLSFYSDEREPPSWPNGELPG